MASLITESQRQLLVEQALAARANAYAPYSKFLVGAALLTDKGKLVAGCNVENSSYGLTLCAERVAASSAIAAGAKGFSAIAIASESGVAPCGACRQFLYEWGGQLEVILVDASSCEVNKITTLDELLPGGFRL